MELHRTLCSALLPESATFWCFFPYLHHHHCSFQQPDSVSSNASVRHLRDCFHPSFFLFLTALPNALVSLRQCFCNCLLLNQHPPLLNLPMPPTPGSPCPVTPPVGLRPAKEPCHSKTSAIKVSRDLENWRELKEEGIPTQKPPDSKQRVNPPQVCGCEWIWP